MAQRSDSMDNDDLIDGSIDSVRARTNSSGSRSSSRSGSRPSSSSRRGTGPRKDEATLNPDKPVLALSGGSDALRRVMRQLTRDSMADKNLAEMEGEDEFTFEDSDVEDENDVTDDDIVENEAEEGHKHLHNGRYLSCKRYPWICVKSNCRHKKEFAGDYKGINKNSKT